MPDLSLPSATRTSRVQNILDEHLQTFGAVPIRAWNVYREIHSVQQRRVYDKTTVANILHDLMVEAATKICIQEPELDYREQYYGMHVVIVEREVVVRFKKFDQNFRVSNVKTEVQEKIHRGDVSLFGDRVRGLVTIGYVPNEARTNYKGIHAVKHGRGGDPTWEVEIGEDEVVDRRMEDLFGVSADESVRAPEAGPEEDRWPEPPTLTPKPSASRTDEPAN